MNQEKKKSVISKFGSSCVLGSMRGEISWHRVLSRNRPIVVVRVVVAVQLMMIAIVSCIVWRLLLLLRLMVLVVLAELLMMMMMVSVEVRIHGLWRSLSGELLLLLARLMVM